MDPITESTTFSIPYSFLILLVLAGLLFLWRYLRKNVLNPLGKGAEKQTTGILKKFASVRGFKVLQNLVLQVDGKCAHIENLLIGYFGLLLVNTCGARGIYFGALDSADWNIAIDDDKQRERIPNPFLEQEQATILMRSLFSRNNIYSVPVEGVVYMTSRSNKLEVHISNNGEILLPGQLKSYLGKSHFERDTGLDVDKIADLLLQNSSETQAKASPSA